MNNIYRVYFKCEGKICKTKIYISEKAFNRSKTIRDRWCINKDFTIEIQKGVIVWLDEK